MTKAGLPAQSGQWKQHVARLVTRRPVGRVCPVGARLVKTNPAPAKSLKIHEKQKIKMSKMAATAAIFGILIFCFSARARFPEFCYLPTNWLFL